MSSAKLAGGAVTSAKIADSSVTAQQADLASIGLARSGRQDLNPVDDSGPAGALTVPLVSLGGVELEGVCTDSPGQMNAGIRMRGTSGNVRYVGVSAFVGNTNAISNAVGTDFVQIGGADDIAAARRTAFMNFTAFGEGTGPGITVTVLAAVLQQGDDCVFTATALGR